MLGIIITALIGLSVISGCLSGTSGEVSAAAISSCNKAVELVIYLSGSMALWGGLMKICDRSGMTAKIAKLLTPITKRLFRGAQDNRKAMSAITMNLTANLLGLGNAATPSGIAAAKELNKLGGGTGKRCIAMLVVLNTASIQLIPSTIAAMRLEHGAKSPFDVTPAILFSSLASVTVGCLAVYALNLKRRERSEH